MEILSGLQRLKNRGAVIHKCMNEALTREPSDGLLQIGEAGTSDLLKRARSQGESFVLEIVLPICKLMVRNLDFVADVLSHLFDEIKNAGVSHSTVSTFTRQAVTLLAEEMINHCASRSDTESKAIQFQSGRTKSSSYTRTGTAFGSAAMSWYSWKAVTKLFTHCEMLGTHDCIQLLVQPLMEIANGSGTSGLTKTSDLEGFLMRLIRSLVAELPAISDNLLRYRALIQQVLLHYVKNHVGEKPCPPQDMARAGNTNPFSVSRGYCQAPTEWYDCKECRALTVFLAAPDRSEWRM